MGDRVSVTLTVLTSLKEAALSIIDEYDSDLDEINTSGELTEFEFSEVNYARLESKKHLTAAGIAWIVCWKPGGGFNAGTGWAIFNEDGTLNANEVYEELPAVTLDGLLEPFKQGPEALHAAFKEMYAAITVPSWENQEEYGKRYKARQLLLLPEPEVIECPQ